MNARNPFAALATLAALVAPAPILAQEWQGAWNTTYGQIRLVGDPLALPPFAFDDAAPHLGGDQLRLGRGRAGDAFGHIRSFRLSIQFR